MRFSSFKIVSISEQVAGIFQLLLSLTLSSMPHFVAELHILTIKKQSVPSCPWEPSIPPSALSINRVLAQSLICVVREDLVSTDLKQEEG